MLYKQINNIRILLTAEEDFVESTVAGIERLQQEELH